MKNPFLIATEDAKGGRAICGGKADLEPPLTLRSLGPPPGQFTATPHKGPDCPYTIDHATPLGGALPSKMSGLSAPAARLA
jgi:hypothetical protein